MDNHVMAKNPANGRARLVSRDKFLILQRSGWTEVKSAPARSGFKAAAGGQSESEKENG